ncbi:hypothetical protein GCM10009813_00170 [Brevibacterium marinum]
MSGQARADMAGGSEDEDVHASSLCGSATVLTRLDRFFAEFATLTVACPPDHPDDAVRPDNLS